MKKDDLFKAIGNISDEYIEEIENEKAKNSRFVFMRQLVPLELVASLVLLVLFIWTPLTNRREATSTSENENASTSVNHTTNESKQGSEDDSENLMSEAEQLENEFLLLSYADIGTKEEILFNRYIEVPTIDAWKEESVKKLPVYRPLDPVSLQKKELKNPEIAQLAKAWIDSLGWSLQEENMNQSRPKNPYVYDDFDTSFVCEEGVIYINRNGKLRIEKSLDYLALKESTKTVSPANTHKKESQALAKQHQALLKYDQVAVEATTLRGTGYQFGGNSFVLYNLTDSVEKNIENYNLNYSVVDFTADGEFLSLEVNPLIDSLEVQKEYDVIAKGSVALDQQITIYDRIRLPELAQSDKIPYQIEYVENFTGEFLPVYAFYREGIEEKEGGNGNIYVYYEPAIETNLEAINMEDISKRPYIVWDFKKYIPAGVLDELPEGYEETDSVTVDTDGMYILQKSKIFVHPNEEDYIINEMISTTNNNPSYLVFVREELSQNAYLMCKGELYTIDIASLAENAINDIVVNRSDLPESSKKLGEVQQRIKNAIPTEDFVISNMTWNAKDIYSYGDDESKVWVQIGFNEMGILLDKKSATEDVEKLSMDKNVHLGSYDFEDSDLFLGSEEQAALDSIEALPVFKNKAYQKTYDEGIYLLRQDLIRIGNAYREALDWELEDFTVDIVEAESTEKIPVRHMKIHAQNTSTQALLRCSEGSIVVYGDGRVEINYLKNMDDLNGYEEITEPDLDSFREKAVATVTRLLPHWTSKNIDKVLQTGTSYENRTIQFKVYPKADNTINELLQSNLHYALVDLDKDGNSVRTKLNFIDKSLDRLGDYPILSSTQAKEDAITMLLEDSSISPVLRGLDADISSDIRDLLAKAIIGQEIVYSKELNPAYYIPAYRFYFHVEDLVEADQNRFFVEVPLVQAEYLQ